MQLKFTSQLKDQFLYSLADTVLQHSLLATSLHVVTLVFGQAKYSTVLMYVINWA